MNQLAMEMRRDRNSVYSKKKGIFIHFEQSLKGSVEVNMKSILSVLFTFCFCIHLAHAQASISIGMGRDKRQTHLHSLKIENEILGDLLIQKYEMSFYNDGTRSSEGELVCPLPEGARIVEYAMDVFGEKRDGVVVSSEKAVFAYEDIVRQKTDPGIVEIDEKNHLFRMRVFPIEAQKEKKVWLTTMRVIENGKIDLGLETLGAAMTSETSIKISNVEKAPVSDGWKFTETEKGNWTAKMEGKKLALKSCSIAVKSLPLQLEWKEKGKIYSTVVSSEGEKFGGSPKRYIGVTQLWWDGSVKANFKILEELTEWMKWIKSGEIQLTIFRDELSKKESFRIKNGECDALLERLQRIEAHGMARPSLLPWKENFDGVIIVSDGEFAEGFKDVPEKVEFPLYSILETSGENFLTDLGELSLRHEMKNLPLSEVGFGKMKSHFIYSGISNEVDLGAAKHKAAYWLWAYHYAKKLRAKAESSFEISAFHTEHQVADGKYSWIVLENIQQHIQYNIPPPDSNKKLMAGWREHIVGKKVGLNQRLLEYSVEWDKRCDELMKAKPLFKQFANGFIRDDVAYWKNMPEEVVKISDEERQTLDSILAKVGQATKEEIIYQQMKEYAEFRDKLFARQKMMFVTITGQVGRPGPTLMQLGTPIKKAIDLAKPSTFGALNRVELLRNGKLYKYNMKIRAHAAEKLYPKDIIRVPEKNFWGRGATGGGGNNLDTDPFGGKPSKRKIENKMTLKKADYKWDKKKTYLQTLSNIPITDIEKWHKEYLALRKEFGWRADFYEEIICFLLEKKAKKLTSRVAQDLAELHPDNTEILRRAGRAFLRNGELEIAKRIFQRIAFLTDNDETSLYDLARVFDREKNYKASSVLYYAAIECDRSSQAESRYIVYMEEMNACIHKGKLTSKDLDELGISIALVRHVPLDVRVNLIWDSEKANVDLIVKNTLLDIYQGEMYANKYNYWRASGDVSQGVGPESAAIREKLIGDYHLTAKFHGDWNDTHKSDTTVTMEVIRNFGSENETRESVTRRLHEGNREILMNLEISPKKK